MTYNKVNQGESSPKGLHYPPQRATAPRFVEFDMYSSSQNESTNPIIRPAEKTNSWKPKIIAAPAWEHPLSQKHLARAPSESDATRYFDRSRQCRRVFIDGVVVWSATAFVCAGMFGVMYYYSHLDFLRQHHKYQYNALITGFSILLGLTFAAQFKQYCEFLRWRFLASGYRTVTEFDDVLGCDGWRTTLKLIFHRHGKGGRWYPAKSQVLAFFWLVTFIAFNVFVALIGLTYSLDNSEKWSDSQPGNVSVAELKYIAQKTINDSSVFREYSDYSQRSAASIWGIRGQSYRILEQSWWQFDAIRASTPKDNLVSTFPPYDTFWHTFVDYAADNDLSNYFFSERSVNVSAVCRELRLLQGGYAGFDDRLDAANNLDFTTLWINSTGQEQSEKIETVQRGSTTWLGRQDSQCGPRCTTIIVLQSANNLTQEDLDRDENREEVPVPEPHIWECNNTVSQIDGYDAAHQGFSDPELLIIPDRQAKILAGAIGWSGMTYDSDEFGYQQNIVRGDDPWYNLPGNATAVDISRAIMKFTTGAIAAMDQPNGHRQTVAGQNAPVIAQQLNVKWGRAGPILAGIPGVQFLMLFAVVWFTRKAIVLEPSAITFAHLLYPVMKDLGEKGALMSGDEIEEKLGEDYKICYSVRPDPEDPGRHEKDHVRHLGILRQTDGYGYVRGTMPEGRYA